jgi:hypothetical protein
MASSSTDAWIAPAAVGAVDGKAGDEVMAVVARGSSDEGEIMLCYTSGGMPYLLVDDDETSPTEEMTRTSMLGSSSSSVSAPLALNRLLDVPADAPAPTDAYAGAASAAAPSPSSPSAKRVCPNNRTCELTAATVSTAAAPSPSSSPPSSSATPASSDYRKIELTAAALDALAASESASAASVATCLWWQIPVCIDIDDDDNDKPDPAPEEASVSSGKLR